MPNKLMVPALTLIWKLEGIGEYLRDCTQDIVDFSKIFSSYLVADGKSEVEPWDFARNWTLAVCEFAGRASSDRADAMDRKRIMFAEDLCGKEFAAAVIQLQENPFYLSGWTNGAGTPPPSSIGRLARTVVAGLSDAPKLGNPTEEAKPGDHAGFTKEGARQPELENCSGCHPFPPADPVLVEEGKRTIHRFAHQLLGGNPEEALFFGDMWADNE